MPKADIAAQGYDLSLNRYREVVHDEIEHRAPLEIIADLEQLETEIQQGLADLKAHALVTWPTKPSGRSRPSNAPV